MGRPHSRANIQIVLWMLLNVGRLVTPAHDVPPFSVTEMSAVNAGYVLIRLTSVCDAHVPVL